MNGQMSRYKESLKNTPKPVMPSQFAGTRIDLKGLLAYAKSKSISPADLSEQEKERFVSERESGRGNFFTGKRTAYIKHKE